MRKCKSPTGLIEGATASEPWWQHRISHIHRLAPHLLVVFFLCLVALNWGRSDRWDAEGFRTYFTQPIMVTTLFDFAWILVLLTLFIHEDARRNELTYWWILPTYPFMPTLGVLLYLIVRNRKFRRLGESPPDLGAQGVLKPKVHS